MCGYSRSEAKPCADPESKEGAMFTPINRPGLYPCLPALSMVSESRTGFITRLKR